MSFHCEAERVLCFHKNCSIDAIPHRSRTGIGSTRASTSTQPSLLRQFICSILPGESSHKPEEYGLEFFVNFRLNFYPLSLAAIPGASLAIEQFLDLKWSKSSNSFRKKSTVLATWLPLNLNFGQDDLIPTTDWGSYHRYLDPTTAFSDGRPHTGGDWIYPDEIRQLLSFWG